MSAVIKFIGQPLGWLMSVIFNLIGNYGISIIIFTLLTKVILFPISMVTQKNSINMVRLMPEENALKIKYIDDKERLADEQLKLYKRYHYHPILSSVPLLIQIPLILGLVFVIYHPLSYILQFDADVITGLKDWLATIVSGNALEENNFQLEIISRIKEGAFPDSLFLSSAVSDIKALDTTFLGLDLSLTPSFKENFELLLIPLFSGLSAWLLCWVQNKINILQVAQGKLTKAISTIFLIAFSTYFSFLVPAGVGLYWIFGNLFAIPSMYLLNIVIDPKKHIDYEYLKKMNEQRIEKEKEHKKYVSRERADYKRFFAVKDMKLMFYSEANGFYKYFKGMIDYICENSDLEIHYVTSDPNDKIFEDERKQIIPYYVSSDKFLIPLFMKLDCKMCVMTTPDLEKYHIKRSRVNKNIEYVYACHGMGSLSTFRKGAFDWYDTILCPGIDQFNELRATEELYGTKKKRLVESGYPLIDEMLAKYESSEHPVNKVAKVLVAPSWQAENIIDLCVEPLLDELRKLDCEIILRPHPQQVRHEPEKFAEMKEKFKQFTNVEIQTDFSSNNPIMESDILITDWSDIAWEFSFVTKRPVLFIDTPMKVMNPEYERIQIEPMNRALRTQVGEVVSPEELEKVDPTIEHMLSHKEEYSERIAKVFEEHVYNIGKSSKLCGRYIIKRLNG